MEERLKTGQFHAHTQTHSHQPPPSQTKTDRLTNTGKSRQTDTGRQKGTESTHTHTYIKWPLQFVALIAFPLLMHSVQYIHNFYYSVILYYLSLLS